MDILSFAIVFLRDRTTSRLKFSSLLLLVVIDDQMIRFQSTIIKTNKFLTGYPAVTDVSDAVTAAMMVELVCMNRSLMKYDGDGEASIPQRTKIL